MNIFNPECLPIYLSGNSLLDPPARVDYRMRQYGLLARELYRTNNSVSRNTRKNIHFRWILCRCFSKNVRVFVIPIAIIFPINIAIQEK